MQEINSYVSPINAEKQVVTFATINFGPGFLQTKQYA